MFLKPLNIFAGADFFVPGYLAQLVSLELVLLAYQSQLLFSLNFVLHVFLVDLLVFALCFRRLLESCLYLLVHESLYSIKLRLLFQDSLLETILFGTDLEELLLLSREFEVEPFNSLDMPDPLLIIGAVKLFELVLYLSIFPLE